MKPMKGKFFSKTNNLQESCKLGHFQLKKGGGGGGEVISYVQRGCCSEKSQ